MALPKEPRQKMINIMYLVLTAILALNVSAEILNAFKVVDSSLLKSNTSLEASNTTLLKSLEDKLAKPETHEKAAIWKPKADQAKIMSDQLIAKIEGYKNTLVRASGFAPERGDTTYKQDDLEAATHLFIDEGKGPELLKDLTAFKKQLLDLDPIIRAEFESKLPIDLGIPPSTTGTNNTWEYNYFHMTPTVAAVTILSKFENDIKNAENQVVTYCHNKIGAVELRMDQAAVLVGQNSNYLMPDGELVITAGVGAYSSQGGTSISIGGANVPVVDGKAIYKTKVSGGGAKTLSVVVNYKDQDNKPQTKTETIEYTVGTPGGAAASADKMNVFYIGVDNPVTVGSPTGWDKTQVSMTGGTLSGSNGNFIARVSAIGTANLSVTANGKTSQFPFRIKRIPDPIIKVGTSGGGRMQAVAFRSQTFVRADLENFDFAAKFTVTGATVYFNIPGDRNVKQVTLTSGNLAPASQYMNLLVPGATVTFDNIKVVGPDNVPRTIQNPPGFSLF